VSGSIVAAAEGPGTRARVLGLLLLVYTFNFVDRQIIGILAAPIQADLSLTDPEFGILGGLAFALFYTALGIPLGALADRTGRSRVIAVSLALWSAFTALCGLATSFWQLFLARLGVGIGEAGGVAPSYALISDYFAPHERARALALFSLGIPLGSALGILFGGWVASTVDWRWAFIGVGLAGLLLAPVFRIGVPEPPRGRYDAAEPAAPPPFREVARSLAAKPSFWLLSFGASFSSMCGYGLLLWLPSFFGRSYGLDLEQTSYVFGAIVFIGGVAGIWAGGTLADRLGQGSKAAYARIPAFAFLAAVPFYAGGVLTTSLPLAFALLLVPQALALMWLGPVLSAVQHLVPPSLRATASASFLFINNLIGLGLGTVFLGMLSDALGARFGADSLRYAILAGLGFYLVAAVLMLLAARRLDRDWHR
jgi:MFS family permease